MKRLKLQEITLTQFKGIAQLHLQFDGKNAVISGDNGTGKTTVYDALLWLLFDEDSQNHNRFSIRPVDAPESMPSVCAVFTVNDVPLTLQKTLGIRWERKRGSARKRFVGNRAEYAVNGIAQTESAYQAVIADLLDAELFQCLTQATYFCEVLDWKRRRALLWRLCPVQSEQELFAAAPQFAALQAACGEQSVEAYHKSLLEKRKQAAELQNTLPIRIDECRQSLCPPMGQDRIALQAQERALTQQQTALQGEQAALTHTAVLSQKKAEAMHLENELRALQLENDAYRQSQKQADMRPVLEQKAKICHAAYRQAQQTVTQLQDEIVSAASGRCPYCGQPLPPDQLQKAQTEQKLAAAQTACCKAEMKWKQAEQAWQTSCAQPVQTIQDIPQFVSRRQVLQEALQAKTAEIQAIEQQSEGVRQALTAQLAQVSAALEDCRRALAAHEQFAQAKARLASLEQQAQQNAAYAEQIEQQIVCCEDFIRYRTACITDSINAQFSQVHFVLFHKNLTNDGIQPCCEATVQGVPYASLNHAMRIHAGLDIITTLSRQCGVSVPIFLDNAESITHLHPLPTQCIRLCVRADLPQLQLTVEETEG